MSTISHSSTIDQFRQWFADCRFAVTAFSGGVDSSLVAWLANHLLGPERNVAVVSASPSLKLSDLDAAKTFCLQHAIPLKTIVTEELSNPSYQRNPSNRCFFCKQTLYNELESFAASIDGAWILNGTNVNDLRDYRPGLEAAKQNCVRSPLAEIGLDKLAIRRLAASLGLECWDKPASPCLSSRIPYGQQITEAKLRQVEAGEAYLIERGFPIVRLRHHGDSATIEVPPNRMNDLYEIEKDLATMLQDIGFQHYQIDAEGFVSGKLNRSIRS